MKNPVKIVFLGGVIFYLIVFLSFFLTGSLFYFGEAVSYEGLMRLLLGLPFASSPTTLPVSLTPYSPLFILPLFTFGKFLKVTSIDQAMLLGRLFQASLLVFLFVSLNRLRKHFFPQGSNGVSFISACGLLFFYSPAMVLALRPDTLSFLCEIWAVYWILSLLKTNRNRCLLFASFFFSAAIAIKLNTIGCFLGALGFFIFSKDFKSCAKLGFLTSIFTLVFLGAHEVVLGEAFSKNILLSIQSQLWNFSQAIEVYKGVFDLFLIPLSTYFFLVFWGVRGFVDAQQAKLFSWILGASFLIAFLGQMKWGAFHNYFLGMLYLCTIPASCGIYRLSEISYKTTYFFVCALMAIFMIRALSIPTKIWMDKRYFDELSYLHKLVQEKVPSGFIYSNDEKIKVGFTGKTAIGVLTEELIWTTPKLRPVLPLLKKSIDQAGGHRAYITKCTHFPPSEWGFTSPEGWEKTQTGYYCLYTHANP